MSGAARNALAGEHSPFLQHGATQPVDWLPWGDAAFERARAQDRAILLDIGAVWCHWCHVMDRESYEAPETAALINELFVPVKVDRDELPDVDVRYQRAVQLLTGQGGWPLTAFLTPDGEVFYGGTYFPPDDRFGRPSFARVLREVARVWRSEREKAVEAARGIGERLATIAQSEVEAGEPAPALLGNAAEELARRFDFRYGGFGEAPKFPNAGALDLLLDEFLDTGIPWTHRMYVETLRAMARGGMYDQLGGGFHRYSTDARWIVPHFEKMAYDNGPLLATYARAFAATGEQEYRRICDGIIDHYLDVAPELLEAGGFPASQDADHGPDDDGDYWTWTVEELANALGDTRTIEIARLHWGLDDAAGRMHLDPSRHVLFVAETAAAIAARLKLAEADVRAVIDAARRQLFAVRRARPQPYVDRTQYTGWVALVASGFLAAARYTGRAEAARYALHALERLLPHDVAGPVPHRVGDTASPALLEDQVFVLLAALDAFELTQEERWLRAADALADVLLDRFAEPAAAALADRAPDAPAAARPLAAAVHSITDSPTPSGNGAAALALFRLAALTGRDDRAARGREIVRAFAGSAARFGSAAATFLKALAWATRDPVQVVVVGAGGQGRELLEAALGTCVPRLVVRWLDAGSIGAASLPEPMRAMVDATSPRAYVCVGRSCHAPVADADSLRRLLGPACE